jgi:uncharacterized protein (UPF0335 family)
VSLNSRVDILCARRTGALSSGGSDMTPSNTNEPVDVSGVAGAQLKAFIERIERLMEEIKGLQDDVKDVYAEAKGSGFDIKVMRKIISMRKRDVSEREEEEAILDLYMQALGMIPGDRPMLEAAE